MLIEPVRVAAVPVRPHRQNDARPAEAGSMCNFAVFGVDAAKEILSSETTILIGAGQYRKRHNRCESNADRALVSQHRTAKPQKGSWAGSGRKGPRFMKSQGRGFHPRGFLRAPCPDAARRRHLASSRRGSERRRIGSIRFRRGRRRWRVRSRLGLTVQP